MRKCNRCYEMEFMSDAKFCPYCGRCVETPVYGKEESPRFVDRGENWEGEIEESHPAYAQLAFSRQSGGHDNLYGSAIKHQDTISMRVYKSVKHVSKYSERYYNRELLLEVRMSNAQFAEAITTLNMGGGVPVTLESLKGEIFPKCVEKTVSERAQEGLSDKLNEFADKISHGRERVNEILSKKGAINKGERKEIKNVYDMLMADLKSNMPFLHDCMTEAYDATAQSTKADIEAFYSNAVHRMGLEAIQNEGVENLQITKGA